MEMFFIKNVFWVKHEWHINIANGKMFIAYSDILQPCYSFSLSIEHFYWPVKKLHFMEDRSQKKYQSTKVQFLMILKFVKQVVLLQTDILYSKSAYTVCQIEIGQVTLP